LGWANFIINPIKVKEKTVGGIIVHCSHNNLFFHNNDFEVIDLFSYNLGVIWERERLSRKVEDLETIDPLTGILKKKTFLSKLKAELDRSRVYQRPCGLVVASLQDYPQANNFIGPEKTEEIMQEIVKVCKDNIRPIDILGRLDSRQIGIILIERNRRQCNYVRIRIKDLIYNFLKEFEPSRIKAEVVVAESPIDGTEAPQLLRCVNSQLKEQ
jgi:diguanylate cyclase (GGDEF)-like protein